MSMSTIGHEQRQLTRVEREWGDAHMCSEDELTPRQQQILEWLVQGNSPEELAIMLIQHFTDQQLKDLEDEVDTAYSDSDTDTNSDTDLL